MRSRLVRTLAQDLQILLQGGSPAYDARTQAALDALLAARRAAEERIALLDDRLIVMAGTRAARRRNWHPRSAVIAALAGWRMLRRHAAAATAVAGAGALIFGYAAVPFISYPPAPAHSRVAVRVHHRSRRPLAVLTSGPQRRRGRRHDRPPGGVAAIPVSGRPVHGRPAPGPRSGRPPSRPPHLPGPVKKLPLPVHLPVKLPPVKLPPPVKKIIGTVTGTAGQVLQSAGGTVSGVTGTVTGTAGDAAGAAGSLLGGL